MKRLKEFIVSEEGLESVEFALLGGIIAIGIIGGVLAVKDWVDQAFRDVPDTIQEAAEP